MASGANYLSVRVQVGWGDCDPAGIVFYPRFYAWMDTVSHVLAREMGIPRESMLPPEDVEKILHHNAQIVLGLKH